MLIILPHQNVISFAHINQNTANYGNQRSRKLQQLRYTRTKLQQITEVSMHGSQQTSLKTAINGFRDNMYQVFIWFGFVDASWVLPVLFGEVNVSCSGVQHGDLSEDRIRNLSPYPSRKQVRVMKTPLHSTFISKIGEYRGIHYFLIFASKHRLWVLVRTASLGRF